MTVRRSPSPAVREIWHGPFARPDSTGPCIPLQALGSSDPGSTSTGGRVNKLLIENKPGSETILYVEDEAVLRGVISDCLSQLGYTVLAASSGQQALSAAAGHGGNIDLLLTDVRMPEMAGPELAALVMAQRPEMKVIYVSGYPEDIVAAHGVPMPGAVFLAKPFTIKVLAAKLREVLG